MNAAREFATRLFAQPWHLWMGQTSTIVRMETRKNFFTRRGFWVYLLAFAPVAIIIIHALVDKGSNMKEDTEVLAVIFHFYYLRLAIFFGCMGIFTRLFRGEMIQRSLHYYLLAPIRREVLVVSKFLAGCISAMAIFGLAISSAFLLMYLHYGPRGLQYVFDGPGLGQLAAYLGIMALACVGYGSVFLAFSMVFRNPIVPGIVLLGWEAINPVLPPTMQKLSVIFYLRHLTPVDFRTEGLFALLAVVTDPVPAWAAVFGLLILALVVLTYSCLRVRSLEINYTTD
ncbi:MAG TPA: ABC transporter permease [Terriglobales bacterium]|nr:ABC transporter permease [Terriglobales bacterium]